MIINKGQIITFTKGDYSDYEITTLAVTTKPFNLKVKMADWKKLNTLQSVSMNCMGDLIECKITGVDFTSYLALHKVIKLVEHTEVHTDNYGAIKIDDKIGWY